MVSRRFLRIKTMQALYAYNANPKANIAASEADLLKSVRGCYTLFLWLFALLPEIAFYRTKKLDSLKEKYNPTAEDLNPNTKFVNNAVIRQIETNKELVHLWPQYHINWEDETENLPGQLAVDVYETPTKLIIKARTAGIERKDLDVSISDNILTISGVLSGGEDDNATQWHIQECYWGEFSRTIALPVQVIEDGVEAVLKDGVLTISFEKEKVEEPKRITIN